VTPDELAALARHARAGDSGARHQLLVELYRAVRKHVFLLIANPAVADDAVQETMIALHRGLDGFRGDANPRTWALAIATRTALRLRRRESRYQITDDGVADSAVFDLAPTEAAELQLLRKALAQLAPKKRDAFVLMAIFELTAEEAGEALGTFANTAASRYRHARAELEAQLRSMKFDESVPVVATKEKQGDD
jgi:RNA polymerase sigma-70 factor (ECF subfamily)